MITSIAIRRSDRKRTIVVLGFSGGHPDLYLEISEWFDLLRGKRQSAVDCSNFLDTFSELWTVHRFESPNPRGDCGRQECPWFRFTVPLRCRDELIAVTSLVSAFLGYEWSRDWAPSVCRIDVSAYFAEALEKHGQGKGTVRIETNDADQVLRDRADRSFARCLEQLEAIARNSTWSTNEVGVLRLHHVRGSSLWGREYSFSAGCLVGGVINHGSEEEPSWSVHT